MLRIVSICALLLALCAASALAADVTGTWTGEMNSPDGNSMSITFHFKQDGTKLTGSVDGPGGNTIEFKDGKVDGDHLSFVVTFDAGGNDMKITHEGTIKGDEITLTTEFEGGPGGEGPAPMKLKRAK